MKNASNFSSDLSAAFDAIPKLRNPRLPRSAAVSDVTEAAPAAKPARARKPKAAAPVEAVEVATAAPVEAPTEAPTEATPAKATRTRKPKATAAPVSEPSQAEEQAVASEPSAAPAPAIRTAGQVAKVLRGEGEIMGAIAFWSVRNSGTVSRSALGAKLEELNLGGAMMREPRPQAMLTYACEAAKRRRNGIVFDRVVSNRIETVMALSERVIDSTAEQASYSPRCRIRVAHDSGALALEDYTNPVLQEVSARYADVKANMTSHEISEVIGNAFKGRTNSALLGGINLRGKAGGVYFVPASEVARTTALADFLGQMNCCELTVWPIAATDRVVGQAAAAAERDLNYKVRKLLVDIKDFGMRLDAEALQNLSLDSSGVKLRMERLNLIESKADIYAEILGSLAGDIRAQVETARASFRTAILGNDFSAFSAFEEPSSEDGDETEA